MSYEYYTMYASKCKSPMESHISYYLASYFDLRPKAYFKNRIQKYIKLQEAKVNGIDIKKLYLKTYDNTNKDYNLNEKELNFSIFEKSSSSNVPIIENGHVTSIFNTLDNINII